MKIAHLQTFFKVVGPDSCHLQSQNTQNPALSSKILYLRPPPHPLALLIPAGKIHAPALHQVSGTICLFRVFPNSGFDVHFCVQASRVSQSRRSNIPRRKY